MLSGSQFSKTRSMDDISTEFGESASYAFALLGNVYRSVTDSYMSILIKTQIIKVIAISKMKLSFVWHNLTLLRLFRWSLKNKLDR